MAEFRRYETYAYKVGPAQDIKFTEEQRREIDLAMQALFGTPDAPVMPAREGVETSKLMNVSRLALAAGPVGRDEQGNPRGLYREHCAHCHGITGDGVGPTAAFLNPYPRDYRKGQFKFKSTPAGFKPTHADLKKIVLDGIPGTAMPSFKLLPDLEVEALVDYITYLAIRGETERELLMETTNLEEKQHLIEVPAKPEQLETLTGMLKKVVDRWNDAEAQVTKIEPRKEMTKDELAASRKHGRELFYGTIANCIKCHGDSALGDGVLNDYDEWTKEFIGNEKDPQQLKKLINKYVSLGMLPPRNIRPRNLRQGVYRGGMRPIDIYWRIMNGIEGTPMPALSNNVRKEGDPPDAKKLSPDEIWDVVNYVQSLPYESISDPRLAATEAENLRERN